MPKIFTYNPTEKQIQNTILLYLKPIEIRGDGYFNRTNTGRLTFKRENGTRGFMNNGTAGQPDITGVYKGWSLYIEVKRRTGKLSPFQIAAHERIRKAGGIVIVAYCIDDVIKELAKLKDRR